MASDGIDQLTLALNDTTTFRIDRPEDGTVSVFSAGYEVAHWDQSRGWLLQINGEEVSLEETIRALNRMQAALQLVLGKPHEKDS